MSSEINAHLRQQGSYGQQREYRIVNGRNIRIAIGNKSRHRIFNVSMLALAVKSKTRLHIAWAWLWLALCGVLAIPVYLAITSHLGINSRILDVTVLGGLALVILAGIIMLAMNFSRKRVFFTEFSKVPLFDILIGKPDNKSYKDFVSVLESYLHKAKSDWNLRADQQIAGEIRMLRRLANEGVIAQKHYENAKGKMFAMNKTPSQSAA